MFASALNKVMHKIWPFYAMTPAMLMPVTDLPKISLWPPRQLGL
jgi:TRAP-type C4-dicarboxylate transport system permease large subunit